MTEDFLAQKLRNLIVPGGSDKSKRSDRLNRALLAGSTTIGLQITP